MPIGKELLIKFGFFSLVQSNNLEFSIPPVASIKNFPLIFLKDFLLKKLALFTTPFSPLKLIKGQSKIKDIFFDFLIFSKYFSLNLTFDQFKLIKSIS